jgi:CHAD domain-containing protein
MSTAPLTYTFQPHKKLSREFVRITREISSRADSLSQRRRDPVEDAVHDGRVLMKRLRALLWFAKPALSPSALERVKAQLRKGSGLLADQRDTAVTRKTLLKLEKKESTTQGKADLAQLKRDMVGAEPSAKEQWQALGKAMAILSECVGLIKRAGRSKTEWSSPKKRVKKAFRATEGAKKKARLTKSDTDFHEWRKKAKRLFYLLELTSADPGRQEKRILKRADKLQDTLGDYHDAAMVEDRIRGKHFSHSSANRVLKLLRRRKTNLRKKARKIDITL